ncbi:BCCT family transporter [Planctobacterium marinum]|uniref:BCCT family transporter n=1 Tax=Planctobacterium marinum TaxID=1631968 RepID=UPI001E647F3F|nr:BCCT family transporter [Planctobacterium marinum]MCC2603771.1 BCCT family transporter [Planctobacterium marinum]
MISASTFRHLNLNVFIVATISITALVLFTLLAPQFAESFFDTLQSEIVSSGSWFYVLTVAVILVTTLYLGLSQYGEVKLGPDHAQPDYNLATWLSMLFAAGMGIGLMFFGVAEPLMHFMAPPTAEPGGIEAVKEAMKMTFFHWGLHAWAIYAIVALILAYFSFRNNLPLTLRSALYPIIGDRVRGWAGHWVDIFAVVSTIFGVATSLGFGAAQINAGLAYLTGIEVNTSNQILLMIAVIAVATVSVVSGLDKGIKILSQTNMMMAVALLLFILILGPTVFLLQAYLQNTGDYLSDLVRNTFNLFAYQKKDWIGGWTIFYWGWWLAWAPFVGIFIARISKGRTIREFILGVMFIPTAFTLFWMTVFGNTAIDLVQNFDSNLGALVNEDTSVALFVFLESFPFSDVLVVLALLMVVVFFVTSCDSGAMVVDMLCSDGNNNTPVWQRIYWALAVGVVAIVLLFAGGLSALQTMTIATALPFSIVLLLAIAGLIKSLRIERHKRESLAFSSGPLVTCTNKEGWRERLESIVTYPNKKTVEQFLDNVVNEAFESVRTELLQYQLEVEIVRKTKAIEMIVKHGEEIEFVYGVYRRKHEQPDYAANEAESLDNDHEQSYYRAEVHLREGGQDYDIMGWSTTAVINDIIDQYHKHQHFLHLMR